GHAASLAIECFLDQQPQGGGYGFVTPWFYARRGAYRHWLLAQGRDNPDAGLAHHVPVAGRRARARQPKRREHLAQVGIVRYLHCHHGHRVVLRIVDERLGVAVANDVEAAIGITDFGRAEFNRLYDALGARDLHRVAHEIRVLEKDEEARDHVVDQRLSTKPEDEPKDSRPGEEGHGIEPERREHEDGGAEVGTVREGRPHERHHSRQS